MDLRNLHVELTDKAAEVAVLEMLPENLFGKFVKVGHNNACPICIPRDQVLVFRIAHHPEKLVNKFGTGYTTLAIASAHTTVSAHSRWAPSTVGRSLRGYNLSAPLVLAFQVRWRRHHTRSVWTGGERHRGPQWRW